MSAGSGVKTPGLNPARALLSRGRPDKCSNFSKSFLVCKTEVKTVPLPYPSAMNK